MHTLSRVKNTAVQQSSSQYLTVPSGGRRSKHTLSKMRNTMVKKSSRGHSTLPPGDRLRSQYTLLARMLSLLALAVLAASTIFRAVRSARRLQDAVQAWEIKALPASTAWRVQESLAACWWLGALRPRPPVHPLHACGIPSTERWWTWVFQPLRAEERLSCLEQAAAQAEQDHLAFRKTAAAVVWCLGVFFLGLAAAAVYWAKKTKKEEKTLTGTASSPTGETLPATVSPLPEESLPASESLPSGETLPASESLPPEETLPASESLSPEETFPASESLPPEETLPSSESLPPEGTLPASESLPPEETLPASESLPPEETLPASESLPPEETLPSSESPSPEETLPASESLPPEETLPASESPPPEETLPASESLPPEETLPASESLPSEETLPASDSLLSEESLPASESLNPEMTLPASEPVPPEETLPATETLLPAESLSQEDTLPAAESFSPEDARPAADSLLPVNAAPAVECFPSENTLPPSQTTCVEDTPGPPSSPPPRNNNPSPATVTIAPPPAPSPTQTLPPPRRPPPPWHCPPPRYDGTLRALHQEVLDFQRWVGGSDAELRRRMRPVEDLRRVVAALWPAARVEATGSLASGLYLPDSDVDVTVLGQWPASPPPLLALRDALQRQGVARPGTLSVLERATVPLVKLVHGATGLPVDVSLGNEAAVRAAVLVRGLLRRLPGLAPLTLLVRQYLRGLGLAEVFTGGVSSYSVTLMSASLLQLQVPPEEQHNFGWLPLCFFNFYGFKFLYATAGISVTDGGRYLRKEDVPTVMPRGHRRADLCIQDPLCPTNDVGRSSFRIWEVRRAFQDAYRVLAPAAEEPGVYAFPGSLLGQLLAGHPAPRRVLPSCRRQRPRGLGGGRRRKARGRKRGEAEEG